MAKANDGGKDLEARVQVLEAFKNKIEGGTTLAKWSLPLSVVSVAAALGGFVWNYSAINKDVQYHKEKLANLETQINSLGTKNEELRKDLDAKNEALVKAINILRQNVVVLFDRQPKGPPNVPQAIIIHGAIKGISAKEVTILPRHLGEPAIQFTIPPKLEVAVNGKPAKPSDLEVGMNVAVLATNDGIQWIRTDD